LLSGKTRYVPEAARVRVHQIWMGDRADDAKAASYTAQDLMIVERDIGRLAKYTFDMGGAGDLLSLALSVPPWEDLHELSPAELRLTNLVTTDAVADVLPRIDHSAVPMAELTPLQEKLGDVLGLALAAPVVLDKVEVRDDDARLAEIRHEAREVQARCAEIAASWGDDVRWDVLAHAAIVNRKAGEQLHAFVKAGTDSIRSYEFMAMAEAGELAATLALRGLNGGSDTLVEELVGFAVPVQERHLRAALAGCVRCAATLLAAAPPAA
jgi:hypothetical protein